MKGFWKSGKWMGLVILALLFAGCYGGSGDSSSEPALANGPGVRGVPITVDPINQIITYGDEESAGGRVPASIFGHTIDIVNDDLGCAGAGPDVSCYIQLINRDSDEYMANAFILGTECDGCDTARLNNADLTHGGAINSGAISVCGALNEDPHNPDGDNGCGNPTPLVEPNGIGMCYVEDGEFVLTGYPSNVYNCATHLLPGANVKPNQMIHPQCGAATARWDFSGQGLKYTFIGQLQADWFPQSPIADGRMDMTNRVTFDVMAVNLVHNAGIGSTARGRAWLRPGSYRLDQVMSGWNAEASNVVAPGGYFAVNVALEYPDRIESQEVADTFGNQNYEYYYNFLYILHYNPAVVSLVVGKAGSRTTPGGTVIVGTTGGTALALKDCKSTPTNYCGFSSFYPQSNMGTSDISGDGGTGTGWVSINMQLGGSLAGAFTGIHGAPGVPMNYLTFYGGQASITWLGNYTASPSYAIVPGMNGHYGRAHLNVPVGGATSWTLAKCKDNGCNIVVQEGVDAAPDLPLAMYYFWVPLTASGKGSEFWIDMHAGATNLMVGITNPTIYPGGAAAGTDDDGNSCVPTADLLVPPGTPDAHGCDPEPPGGDSFSYWVFQGTEKVNTNILHSGAALGFVGAGAYQQWSANICVQ